MQVGAFVKMSVLVAALAVGASCAASADSAAVARTNVAASGAPVLPDATLTRTERDGATVLRIDGIITHGLEREFLATLDGLPASRAVVIELSSPGGYTSAGYRMIDRMLAERERGRAVATRVRGDESCESMCVGVFLAGFPRYAAPSSEFMVHAPRMAEDGRMSLRTTETMVRRLVSLGASEGWIDRVRQAGGFSGSLDYRESAASLTADGANIVTELTR